MHPLFAQVQDFLGYPLGRPTAPFLYTNDWGGVYALTIPFFILGWLQSRKASRRSAALLILGISLVPAFLSLNWACGSACSWRSPTAPPGRATSAASPAGR